MVRTPPQGWRPYTGEADSQRYWQGVIHRMASRHWWRWGHDLDPDFIHDLVMAGWVALLEHPNDHFAYRIIHRAMMRTLSRWRTGVTSGLEQGAPRVLRHPVSDANLQRYPSRQPPVEAQVLLRSAIRRTWKRCNRVQRLFWIVKGQHGADRSYDAEFEAYGLMHAHIVHSRKAIARLLREELS
jgi:hypothetical protein